MGILSKGKHELKMGVQFREELPQLYVVVESLELLWRQVVAVVCRGCHTAITKCRLKQFIIATAIIAPSRVPLDRPCKIEIL
jgi:hypothetical protein